MILPSASMPNTYLGNTYLQCPADIYILRMCLREDSNEVEFGDKASGALGPSQSWLHYHPSRRPPRPLDSSSRNFQPSLEDLGSKLLSVRKAFEIIFVMGSFSF